MTLVDAAWLHSQGYETVIDGDANLAVITNMRTGYTFDAVPLASPFHEIDMVQFA